MIQLGLIRNGMDARVYSMNDTLATPLSFRRRRRRRSLHGTSIVCRALVN